jgi:hypothetical protein
MKRGEEEKERIAFHLIEQRGVMVNRRDKRGRRANERRKDERTQ